jgi:hypothetical protein
MSLHACVQAVHRDDAGRFSRDGVKQQEDRVESGHKKAQKKIEKSFVLCVPFCG